MKLTYSILLCVLSLLFTACDRSDLTSRLSQAPVKQLSGVVPGSMVLVPAGAFIMGSDRVDDTGKQQEYGLIDPLYKDEHPQHTVVTPAYFMDVYEVTNADYKKFVRDTQRKEPIHWSQNGYNLLPARLKTTDLPTLRWIAVTYFKLDMDTEHMPKQSLLKAMYAAQAGKDLLPVTGVSWQDADAYCRSVGKRLPSEQEWEKAVRGPDGRIYPWGNDWNEKLTNTGDDSEWEEGVAPIGSYPQNQSPYGIYDLAGNVWEWVADWYHAYPGADFHHELYGEKQKVVRGGGGGVGHYALSLFFRGSARSHADPTSATTDIGFRCAKDAT